MRMDSVNNAIMAMWPYQINASNANLQHIRNIV